MPERRGTPPVIKATAARFGQLQGMRVQHVAAALYMHRLFGVSASGCYAYRDPPDSERARGDAR